MSTSLRTLKGVGEKTEKLFAKIGVTDMESLLSYYPRNYDAYEEPVEIRSLEEGAVVAISVAVITGVYVNQVRNLQVITTTVADLTGKISVTWFNAPYLRSAVRKGSRFVLRGRVVRKQGKLQMEHPEIFTPAAYEEILHSLQPIYGLTAGLSNKTIVKLIHQVLDEQKLQAEYLADEYKERYHLADRNFAIPAIHFPKNMQELLAARRRLVFDEFLLFILAVQSLKEKTEEAPNAFPMHPVWTTEQIIESLPYDLTKAQLNVWHEIERDLSGQALMSRLVQGDVGSGKTILAVLALIMAGCNGYQGALMVPTEVLAKQHYQSVKELLEIHHIPLRPILLTGSMTAKEKRLAREEIESGKAQIIIGTHALIQEKVIYRNLGLVVTDEQHRFGVKQREMLAEKGRMPHVLVMSATPIPRTLAIIIYGDLDISVVDEMPAHRLPIKNCVVDESYRPNAYRFMKKEVEAGHQVYIICPMVEENEELELENVTDYTEKLKGILPEFQISCLHGKMKPKEKNEIMEAFADGQIQILVSTTVIEVGINVPNATVMMVENAERFGLAQLHQLRGRVGRGREQSYCIFMSGSKGKETKKRLEVLNQSNDGFYIASEDLKLRGPGDLFGIRQSGVLEFRMGDVFQDSRVLEQASEAAGRILEEDAELALPKHEKLKERLEAAMAKGGENLSL